MKSAARNVTEFRRIAKSVARTNSRFCRLRLHSRSWRCLLLRSSGHASAPSILSAWLGKIIPSGRTKTIQPFETGVVRAIHVRDGQSVSAGDVLIELDPTISGASSDT
jgi:acetyl/propionyl-CoA carboxylase alpha subunit